MWFDGVMDRRTVLCVLDAPPPTGEELLRHVLTGFGLVNSVNGAVPDVSAVQMIQVLQRFLASLRPLRARAFIVIENAQAAASATREEMQRLSDLDPSVLEVLLVNGTDTGHGLVLRRAAIGAACIGAVLGILYWFAQPAGTRAVVGAQAVQSPAKLPAARQPDAAAPATPSKSSRALGSVEETEAAARFRIQIGAFRDSARVEAVIARVRALKLPVHATLMRGGLQQVSSGPYLLRAEAADAQARLSASGFGQTILMPVTDAGAAALSDADRRLLARAAALAETPDVRALESLRQGWIDASAGNADATSRTRSMMLALLDRYLQAGQRRQLLADHRLMSQEGARP